MITNTERGGAESMLLKLLRLAGEYGIESSVVSLIGCGAIGEQIQQLGIPVLALQMRKRPTDVWRCSALATHLRRVKPDVVQTWMYHADLLGGLAARLAGIRAVWNVRHGPLDPSTDAVATRLVAQVCGRFSGVIPAVVVFNSHAAAESHRKVGYASHKQKIIPNGFDTHRTFARRLRCGDSFARNWRRTPTFPLSHTAAATTQ